MDNHAVPEVRIGPVGEAYNGSVAEFDEWKQFNKFVDALNDVRDRLAPSIKKSGVGYDEK